MASTLAARRPGPEPKVIDGHRGAWAWCPCGWTTRDALVATSCDGETRQLTEPQAQAELDRHVRDAHPT